MMSKINNKGRGGWIRPRSYEDGIDLNEIDWIGVRIGTLDGLFRERVRRTPNSLAYREFDYETKEWRDHSWGQMADLVSRWQLALRAEKLLDGDRVALQLKNCTEWVAFEQATIGLGLVLVPLYCEDRPDNVTYILRDAGVQVLLVDTLSRWEKLRENGGEELDALKRVLVLNKSHKDGTPDDERVVFVEDWMAKDANPLRERGGDPHKLATIVYTSGTTGRPKGVMLSHRNILSVADAALQVIPFTRDDLLLSFLPLSHTFERTCGYYASMMKGSATAYSRSVQQLADDIIKLRPTLLVSVPRIFERIYDRMQQQLETRSPLAKALFKLTVSVGWRRFQVRQGRGHRSPSLLLWPILRRLVVDKFTARLGGRLKLAVSGGAALPPAVARVFLAMDLTLIQGYGMTETAPVVSCNLPDNNDPNGVGLPLPGIQVRTGDNDELMVRTPGQMLGYWNNHKATSEVIDPEGWVHTGDKARIENGQIYITGRIKDILVLSNGEKIPPTDMEAAITLDPLFEQAMVVGEGRPFLGALVVLNPDRWFSLAQEHELDPFDQNALVNSRLQKSLLNKVSDLLHDFPGYAKIRRIAPLLDGWTIDNGLLTPTLKVKRNVVLEYHADLVNTLYQ